jgi:adenylate cyclase
MRRTVQFGHLPTIPILTVGSPRPLGQLGQIDEAGQALEKAIAIAPAAFDLYVRERAPWRRPEDHARMIEGLRKAGLPEE